MLKCKEVLSGDILICRLAEPAGRACIIPDVGESQMITSVDVSIFRPKTEKADRKFLLNVFCTPEWFHRVLDKCGGSTRTRISRTELGKIPIKIPSIQEQQTIGLFLSDMDTEIESLERKRDKYRAIKQGMMQELLTGKTRLMGGEEGRTTD
ncbi:MAG: restriction endonuclease subunit S [Saprospirales bacterium]|nr:restriction endonuclease subunit S [Saprospirales bacterium]